MRVQRKENPLAMIAANVVVWSAFVAGFCARYM